jgi:hypothetical protein
MRATALEFDADVRAIDGECTSRYSTGSPLRGYGRAHRCLDRDRGEDRQHCSEEQHADSANPGFSVGKLQRDAAPLLADARRLTSLLPSRPPPERHLLS